MFSMFHISPKKVSKLSFRKKKIKNKQKLRKKSTKEIYWLVGRRYWWFGWWVSWLFGLVSPVVFGDRVWAWSAWPTMTRHCHSRPRCGPSSTPRATMAAPSQSSPENEIWRTEKVLDCFSIIYEIGVVLFRERFRILKMTS